MGKRPERFRPTSTALATGDVLDGHLAGIESVGGTVVRDKVGGTATATDPAGVVVLRAIRKGRRGYWIVMFYNSKCVKWRPATPRRSEP